MEKIVNGILLTTDFSMEDIEYSKKRHVEIFDGEYGFSEYFNRYATVMNNMNIWLLNLNVLR